MRLFDLIGSAMTETGSKQPFSVYFSYTYDSKDWVIQLCDILGSAIDQSARPRARTQITNMAPMMSLQEADFFIPIVTSSWHHSKVCRSEYTQVQRLDKIVVPILFDRRRVFDTPTSIHLFDAQESDIRQIGEYLLDTFHELGQDKLLRHEQSIEDEVELVAKLFREGKVLYDQGSFKKSLIRFKTIIRDYPTSVLSTAAREWVDTIEDMLPIVEHYLTIKQLANEPETQEEAQLLWKQYCEQGYTYDPLELNLVFNPKQPESLMHVLPELSPHEKMLLQIDEAFEKGSWTLRLRAIEDIPREIEKLRNLRTLEIEHTENRKGSIREISIPDEIGALTQLTSLTIKGTGVTRIPTSIGNLVALKQLNISWNLLLEYLPSSIGNLINLRELNLEYNSLKTLPDEIQFLTSLVKLYLHRNEIDQVPTGLIKLVVLNRGRTNLPVMDKVHWPHFTIRGNPLSEVPRRFRRDNDAFQDWCYRNRKRR